MNKTLAVVIGVLCLSIGGWFISGGVGPGGAAVKECVEQMRPQLRAPSAAVVAEVIQDGLLATGDRRIRLAIDDQDALGARIRSHWSCLLPKQGAAKVASIDERLWSGMKNFNATEISEICGKAAGERWKKESEIKSKHRIFAMAEGDMVETRGYVGWELFCTLKPDGTANVHIGRAD